MSTVDNEEMYRVPSNVKDRVPDAWSLVDEYVRKNRASRMNQGGAEPPRSTLEPAHSPPDVRSAESLAWVFLVLGVLSGVGVALAVVFAKELVSASILFASLSIMFTTYALFLMMHVSKLRVELWHMHSMSRKEERPKQ